MLLSVPVGARTAGPSTANEGFELPDGSTLWLTVATFVDRTGQAYEAGVRPDLATLAGKDGDAPGGASGEASAEEAFDEGAFDLVAVMAGAWLADANHGRGS